MLDSPLPLSLVKICSLFSAISVDDVIFPSAFVDPSIDIVKNSLAVLLAVSHLSLISFPVARDEYSLPRGHIIFPLAQIDVPIVGLKNASSVFLIIFYLSLIRLSGGVLDLVYVFEKFSIGAVDVILEEGLDDAFLLLFQSGGVD